MIDTDLYTQILNPPEGKVATSGLRYRERTRNQGGLSGDLKLREESQLVQARLKGVEESIQFLKQWQTEVASCYARQKDFLLYLEEYWSDGRLTDCLNDLSDSYARSKSRMLRRVEQVQGQLQEQREDLVSEYNQIRQLQSAEAAPSE